MSNMTKDFITKIKNARTCKSAAKAVDQLLSAPLRSFCFSNYSSFLSLERENGFRAVLRQKRRH